MNQITLKCDFTKSIPQQLEMLLLSLHGLSPDIDELILPNCGLFCLKDSDLALVARSIPPTITRLSIPNNHLGKRLYFFLENAPASIQYLDLSHNQLIQLSLYDYNEIISTLPLPELKMHNQDFRVSSPCFNSQLQRLYLSEVHELKYYSFKRQRFIARSNFHLPEIYLDNYCWIPYADKLSQLVCDTNQLILSFWHVNLSDVVSIVNMIPQQVTSLDLDFSHDLWLMVHELGHADKVEFFLQFPQHLQKITCNDHPVFKRRDLLSMQSMFKDKKTVSQVLSEFEGLNQRSYR